MLGTVYLEWYDDNLSSFDTKIELSEEEYVKMLNQYCGLGAQFPSVEDNKEKKQNYVSCKCDVCDIRTLTSLSVNDFFDIVYRKNGVNYLTLLLNYEKMDEEFESEVKEWIHTTQRMLNKGISDGQYLPTMTFILSFLNDSNQMVYFELCDAFLVKNENNKISIGVPLVRLIEEGVIFE